MDRIPDVYQIKKEFRIHRLLFGVRDQSLFSNLAPQCQQTFLLFGRRNLQIGQRIVSFSSEAELSFAVSATEAAERISFSVRWSEEGQLRLLFFI
jgi:hypothetical protein